MGFRGRPFQFESPGDAVRGFVDRLGAPADCGAEPVSLSEAQGRVLAEGLTADRDSPPFDASAMDGFAVRAAEASPGETLPIVGEVLIGTAPTALPDGPGAIRLVTGAAIPPGTNAVVRREDVDEHPGGRGTITILARDAHRVRPGDHMRRRGENACRGDILLQPGVVLTAAMIGTLAAAGCAAPRVRARCRVAVITTGDELVSPSQAPGPYQIRDSNGPVVRAALGACRWVRIENQLHVSDDGEQLARALREVGSNVDAVVMTGGVSMGHRDPVREAVEAIGAEVVFHGLPQRPGKPMLGAILRRADGAPLPIFGLPGNPVSAMVTCVRVVVPVLAARAGCGPVMGPPVVQVENPDGRALDLWWHRLVRRSDRGGVELLDARGSGDIAAAGRSDGFIEVPPGGAQPNSRYPFYSWPA